MAISRFNRFESRNRFFRKVDITSGEVDWNPIVVRSVIMPSTVHSTSLSKSSFSWIFAMAWLTLSWNRSISSFLALLLVLFLRQMGVRSGLLGLTDGVLELFFFLKHATAVPPAKQTIPTRAEAATTRILKGKDEFSLALPDLKLKVVFCLCEVAGVSLVVVTSSSIPPVWFGAGEVSVCSFPTVDAASLAPAKIKTTQLFHFYRGLSQESST